MYLALIRMANLLYHYERFSKQDRTLDKLMEANKIQNDIKIMVKSKKYRAKGAHALRANDKANGVIQVRK